MKRRLLNLTAAAGASWSTRKFPSTNVHDVPCLTCLMRLNNRVGSERENAPEHKDFRTIDYAIRDAKDDTVTRSFHQSCSYEGNKVRSLFVRGPFLGKSTKCFQKFRRVHDILTRMSPSPVPSQQVLSQEGRGKGCMKGAHTPLNQQLQLPNALIHFFFALTSQFRKAEFRIPFSSTLPAVSSAGMTPIP